MKITFLSVDSIKVVDVLAQILVAMLRNIFLVSDATKTRRNMQTFLRYFVETRRPFYDIS
jgi:hypothetical protein